MSQMAKAIANDSCREGSNPGSASEPGQVREEPSAADAPHAVDADRSETRQQQARQGCRPDNIFIERLSRPQKQECVDLSVLETGSQAGTGIARSITFCNHHRPHAAHGGQPTHVVCINSKHLRQSVSGLNVTLTMLTDDRVMKMDHHIIRRSRPTNLDWVGQVFQAKAAAVGGVVRRSVRDVEREVGRDAFIEAVRQRGFHLIECGGQFIVICNPGHLRLIT